MAPSHQHSSEQALRIAFLYWIHFRLMAKTVWNWLCHFILDIFRNGILTLSTFCTQFRGWDCSDFNPWLIFTFPVLVMVSCVNIFVFSLLLSENLLLNCFLEPVFCWCQTITAFATGISLNVSFAWLEICNSVKGGTSF